MRAGAPADDPSPWDLSALDTPVTSPDTGEAGAPERKYVAVGRETARTIAAHHAALGRANWAAEFREVNPSRDWLRPIYAGDVLTIPAPWPVERTYVVQKGDFAQAIAGKCGGLDRPNWWDGARQGESPEGGHQHERRPNLVRASRRRGAPRPRRMDGVRGGRGRRAGEEAHRGSRRTTVEPQRSRWTQPRWTRPGWTRPRWWRW